MSLLNREDFNRDRVVRREPCPKCRAEGKDHTGDNVAVYSNGDKYCFAGHGVVGREYKTLHQIMADVRAKQKPMYDVPKDLDWPADATPLQTALYAKNAQAWLRMKGITPMEIEKHKMAWSQERQLLLFPVFNTNGEMIMWQGRNFGHGSKYLTKGPKADILHLVGNSKSGTIIACEDLVSAIKVGRQFQAVPLWGSEMSLTLIREAAKRFDDLGIWLDPDKNVKAVEIALRASQYLPTFVCNTVEDPKEYGDEQIAEVIEGFRYKDRLYQEGAQEEPPMGKIREWDKLISSQFSQTASKRQKTTEHDATAEAVRKARELGAQIAAELSFRRDNGNCICGWFGDEGACQPAMAGKTCLRHIPSFQEIKSEHEFSYGKDTHGS